MSENDKELRVVISIHTPHAGSDKSAEKALEEMEEFQSTLPMRGATKANGREKKKTVISIHTPHAGSDSKYS